MKTYLMGAGLILTCASAFAQNYEKNNLPCIAEVCLGDGLSELAGINWERARYAMMMGGKPSYADAAKISPRDMQNLRQSFPGVSQPAANYLQVQSFDKKALDALKKVTAACREQELEGRFTSASGNPTTVKIALLPDKGDVKIQRWTVIGISRNFPEVKSDTQQVEARKQLDERYGRFSVNRGIQKGVNAMYSVNEDPYKSGKYGFNLSMSPDIKDQERYRQHPACGGGKPVSIE